MPIRKHKPTSPGRRNSSVQDFSDLTKKRPQRGLTERISRKGGRNNQGVTTARFRGGGHRRLYRIVDFRRDKDGVPGKVAAIEYDPNRSARIALIHYRDGEKRYILAPGGLEIGQTVMSGEKAEPPTSRRDCRSTTSRCSRVPAENSSALPDAPPPSAPKRATGPTSSCPAARRDASASAAAPPSAPSATASIRPSDGARPDDAVTKDAGPTAAAPP